jgi:hypothetical protein
MTTYLEKDGALFSTCRKYRFALWREWSDIRPAVMFIGLNPSTANESVNDPTIRKVRKIANHNGYGKVFMLNLYPIISSDPAALKPFAMFEKAAENKEAIRQHSQNACDVVFAWGGFEEAKTALAMELIAQFPKALCITQNADGSPKHPLYCKDTSNLIPFDSSKIFL